MAGFLRYQIFLSYGILVLALWYGAVQNKSSLVDEGSTLQGYLVDYLPLWILLCLAVYAIGSVVYGVANFADCPQAAREVERHIEEAKAAMKKKGIID
mmetsp:Transcript_18174/g.22890  ORF Transcript_18174/g.22890 Transcript_18174/m.22890 type:complete len:98 (-) Transcript_18174:314-607(-)